MYDLGMRFITVLIVLFLIVGLAGLGFTYKRWEGQPPAVQLDHDFNALGRTPSLKLTVSDSGTGLRDVVIHLKQKDQDVVLASDSFPKNPAAKSKSYDVGSLISEKAKITPGPATLTVDTSDYSLRNFLKGNRTELTKAFEFHTQPPRVEVLAGQHYINEGGSECVVYRVSDDAVTSGVQVGEQFFPGYSANVSDKNLHFALFALKYDWPEDTPIKVIARDAAGNQAEAEFWKKVFPKKFRSRDIPLDDAFLHKVVPEVMSQTPQIKDQGDIVKNFVEINSNLRRIDHEKIAQLATQSPGKFLWNGPFIQLSNSKVEAAFADRRTYLYKGERVDQQDHVGFDLSVVQQTPIQASNDGKVVLAEYFGIYGNAVIIDHGAGLLSLYGHMTALDVKPGQMVKKGDVIGKSGATGLAAGDHLHFGLFLQGVPVNPTEWWDGKWIQDHVLDRFADTAVQTSSNQH
jgi:murein DD-endopeptidase MepM/ murein hydrolase activator NlpD